MQNDLATLTAQPRTLTVEGQAYDVHPLKIEDVGALQKWVHEQYPDPIATVHARCQGLPLKVQQHLMGVAAELACRPLPKIGTPEADGLLESVDGIKEILFLAIRRGRPAFTRADAEALFAKLSEAELARVFRDTGVAAVVGDPKA